MGREPFWNQSLINWCTTPLSTPTCGIAQHGFVLPGFEDIEKTSAAVSFFDLHPNCYLLMIGNSVSLLCCHPNVHCLFVQIVSESPFLIGHIISSTSVRFHVVFSQNMSALLRDTSLKFNMHPKKSPSSKPMSGEKMFGLLKPGCQHTTN